MSYTYLASPYSSPDSAIEAFRFHQTARITALLLRDNIPVYSPIVHCHYLSRNFSLPGSFDFWQSYNRTMIQAASAFAFIMLEGWEQSVGLKAEHKYAEGLGLPILVWHEDGNNYGLTPLK